jgi:hypothetical protein
MSPNGVSVTGATFMSWVIVQEQAVRATIFTRSAYLPVTTSEPG